MSTTTNDAAPIGTGELTNTEQLRQEIHTVQGLIEQAEGLAGLLRDWQRGLDDSYESGAAAGGPKTRALDEAVTAVTEADADALVLAEALNIVRRACEQADALGEQADAMGADGHTSGYVAD